MTLISLDDAQAIATAVATTYQTLQGHNSVVLEIDNRSESTRATNEPQQPAGLENVRAGVIHVAGVTATALDNIIAVGQRGMVYFPAGEFKDPADAYLPNDSAELFSMQPTWSEFAGGSQATSGYVIYRGAQGDVEYELFFAWYRDAVSGTCVCIGMAIGDAINQLASAGDTNEHLFWNRGLAHFYKGLPDNIKVSDWDQPSFEWTYEHADLAPYSYRLRADVGRDKIQFRIDRF